MSTELLTTREVENLMQVNRVTIYRLIREANFPAVKIGGRWRFPRKDVESWLEQRGHEAHIEAARQSPEPGSSAAPSASYFNSPEITSLLKSFASATRLSVLIVDLDGNLLADCVGCRHPFCQMVYQASGGMEFCQGMRAAQESGHNHDTVLMCSSGLRYIQAPVNMDGSAVARVLMGPLVIDNEQYNTMHQTLTQFSYHIGADTKQVLQQAETIQQFSHEQVEILVKLLSEVTSNMLHVVKNQRSATERMQEIARLVQEE